MSRTLRRCKRHLVREYVGNFEEFVMYEQWFPNRNRYYEGCIEYNRFKNLDMYTKYVRKIVRFTRDRRSGTFNGAPRWWRRTHGTKPMRLKENHKLYVHQRDDNWDEHLPENRYCRNAYYYNW